MIRILSIVTLSLIASCVSVNAGHHADAKDHHEAMKKHGPHIISVKSNHDFADTLATAIAGINARGFKTFAVIDHAGGAASIDAELRPTTLIIFGNPKGGTPLMQAEQLMGLQLPLKILVAEDETGTTHISYPDMAHTFHEYGISQLTTPLGKIEGALAAIAAEASGG